MARTEKIGASFRDPQGFIFTTDNGTVYRQVNFSYKENYDLLIRSGLYKKLVGEKFLTSHEEDKKLLSQRKDAYKILKPKQIPFISYPYEWSFSQLKDAALLTLKIQKISLDYNMSLKDASAYNIQFLEGKPIFIDTLSLEKYDSNKPWVAYKQFCQHFLAPLSLMAFKDVRLSKLSQNFIDGVPLDLTSKLLPFKSRFNPGILIHLHLHSASQKKYADKSVKKTNIKFSKRSHLGILDSLEAVINNLKWRPTGTEWADYYNKTNYQKSAFRNKAALVEKFIVKAKPKIVWDLGGNTGEFSRLAAKRKIDTISFDIDPAAVEINYLEVKKKKEANILPLQLDLTNPSPDIGWNNEERTSLTKRGPADCLLALALIHHLAISNNVPFIKISEYFSKLGKSLIIEFVPKKDSQVQKLLTTREDIFPHYDEENFEKEFGKFFSIIGKTVIKGSFRTLYLMSSKK